jgi:hypothetical protein
MHSTYLTIQHPTQLIRIAIWMMLFLLIGQIHRLQAQSLSGQSFESFGSHEGFSRYYHQGDYYMINDDTDEVYHMGKFNSVGDFHHGVAVVRNEDGNYGLINQKMETVLEAEWSAIKPITYNYVAVASHTGNYIKEDRGRGVRSYPEESWQLVDLRNNVLFSHMEFSDLTAVYGEVRARTTGGEEVAINLSKINVGYTDPLMKAVSYLQR